jgi:hypothetical protein
MLCSDVNVYDVVPDHFAAPPVFMGCVCSQVCFFSQYAPHLHSSACSTRNYPTFGNTNCTTYHSTKMKILYFLELPLGRYFILKKGPKIYLVHHVYMYCRITSDLLHVPYSVYTCVVHIHVVHSHVCYRLL